MTGEQLRSTFSQAKGRWKGREIDRSALIKALIYAWKDHFQNSAEIQFVGEDKRGCRELWYVIKPVVAAADPEWINSPEKGKKGGPPDYFESILAKEIENTGLLYSDLGVLDYRTMRRIWEDCKRANCWSNVVLFVEKDSVAIHLIVLAKLLNVTLISGAGWAHKAGVEATMDELTAKGIKSIVVFGLTDYDNFGFAIFERFLRTCEKKYGLEIIEHHRIGVNPKHLSAERIKVAKYPLKRNVKCTFIGVHDKEVCCDSEVWLKKYGLPDEHGEKRFGLEIEAVSGQDNGHQIIREIVAQEILGFLQEQDRINEITGEKWARAPFEAIKSFIYAIDRQENVTDEAILGTLKFPSTFMTHSTFSERFWQIDDAEKAETADTDEEIAVLKEKLEQLQNKRKDIANPYYSQKSDLLENYLKSRDLIAHALYLYHQDNVSQYPRENFSLGFPPGCVLEAVRKGLTLEEFLKPVEDPRIDKPIQDALISDFSKSMADGTIGQIVSDIFNKANKPRG
jgi:hypothetical protein